MQLSYILVYVALAVAVVVVHVVRRRMQDRAHEAVLKEAMEGGMGEPPSLHPIIDPVRCVGSAACAKACPEEAIGIIRGKAVLVNPAARIGHGAGLPAWPVDAIKPVFGTEERGIDLPVVH